MTYNTVLQQFASAIDRFRLLLRFSGGLLLVCYLSHWWQWYFQMKLGLKFKIKSSNWCNNDTWHFTHLYILMNWDCHPLKYLDYFCVRMEFWSVLVDLEAHLIIYFSHIPFCWVHYKLIQNFLLEAAFGIRLWIDLKFLRLFLRSQTLIIIIITLLQSTTWLFFSPFCKIFAGKSSIQKYYNFGGIYNIQWDRTLTNEKRKMLQQ